LHENRGASNCGRVLFEMGRKELTRQGSKKRPEIAKPKKRFAMDRSPVVGVKESPTKPPAPTPRDPSEAYLRNRGGGSGKNKT